MTRNTAGEVAPVAQGVGVLGAAHPLADRQQVGVLVPGRGRVTHLARVLSDASNGVQGP